MESGCPLLWGLVRVQDAEAFERKHSKRMEEMLMKPVEVMLKEYETLRKEQAMALNQGYQLVCYGLVALAFMGAGTLTIASEEAFAGLVSATLCYALPLLASVGDRHQ